MGRSVPPFPARITQSLCKRSSVAYESKERRELRGSQHAQKHGYFIENPSSLRPAVSRIALAPCVFFFFNNHSGNPLAADRRLSPGIAHNDCTRL